MHGLTTVLVSYTDIQQSKMWRYCSGLVILILQSTVGQQEILDLVPPNVDQKILNQTEMITTGVNNPPVVLTGQDGVFTFQPEFIDRFKQLHCPLYNGGQAMAPNGTMINCGPPPPICGTYFLTDRINNPSFAVYKCLDDGENVGGTGESFCNDDGKWTTPTIKCFGLKYIPVNMKQEVAKGVCRDLGMTLINIRTQQERSAINKFLNDMNVSTVTWTGLEYQFPSGVFRWPDGRVFNDEDEFFPGFPNTLPLNKCVGKDVRPTRLLGNIGCLDTHHALCSCQLD